MTQGGYEMVLCYALDSVKRPEATVSLNIAGKPLAKVLCHCEASWRCVDTFIKASQ